MSNFGEALRKERLSRGIELEDISSVTKISQRHLVALEQERFRLLPGGILSKGIVRGYASALGLDQQDWTQRFLQAYSASVQVSDDDRDWTTFASNDGMLMSGTTITVPFNSVGSSCPMSFSRAMIEAYSVP